MAELAFSGKRRTPAMRSHQEALRQRSVAFADWRVAHLHHAVNLKSVDDARVQYAIQLEI